MSFCSFQKLYANVLSQDFPHNIDAENFRSFFDSGMGVVAVAHHAMADYQKM